MKAFLSANYPITLACCLVLLLNIYYNSTWINSILNSGLLGISWYFFQKHGNSLYYFSQRKNPILPLMLLGTLPILRFNPISWFIPLLLLLCILALIICPFLGKLKWILLLISFGGVLLGNLIAGDIINLTSNKSFYSINYEHTIIFNNSGLELFRKDIINQSHLPGRVSAITYHPVVIYSYAILTNSINFFSLENIYISLLLANVYPLVMGLYIYCKKFSKENKSVIIWFLLGFIIIGINRSHDTLSSLYFSTPILLFLILKGFEKVNFKYYWILIIISFLLSFSPKL